VDPLAIDNLKNEISRLRCGDNVACFLLYGSIFEKKEKINDTDIIVVLKDISLNSDELSDFIFRKFHNPDFHLYSLDEVDNNLSFFTREYVLEYLAKGVSLYGENIFQKKFAEITKSQYLESILIRSIEHVQMVRKVYFSQKHTPEYKLSYVKKYSIRVARNILLFRGISDYVSLDALSPDQILELLKKNNLLTSKNDSFENSANSLEHYYRIFCDISVNLINCKKELSRG
jgi:hypothetical protein